MFVPDWILLNNKKINSIAVVYGMIDALVLSSLRIPVTTSTSGKLTFKAEWLKDYRKAIYVIPDKGEDKDAFRLASELGWRGRVIKLNYSGNIKDPAGYAENGLQSELLNQLGGLT